MDASEQLGNGEGGMCHRLQFVVPERLVGKARNAYRKSDQDDRQGSQAVLLHGGCNESAVVDA